MSELYGNSGSVAAMRKIPQCGHLAHRGSRIGGLLTLRTDWRGRTAGRQPLGLNRPCPPGRRPAAWPPFRRPAATRLALRARPAPENAQLRSAADPGCRERWPCCRRAAAKRRLVERFLDRLPSRLRHRDVPLPRGACLSRWPRLVPIPITVIRLRTSFSSSSSQRPRLRPRGSAMLP